MILPKGVSHKDGEDFLFLDQVVGFVQGVDPSDESEEGMQRLVQAGNAMCRYIPRTPPVEYVALDPNEPEFDDEISPEKSFRGIHYNAKKLLESLVDGNKTIYIDKKSDSFYELWGRYIRQKDHASMHEFTVRIDGKKITMDPFCEHILKALENKSSGVIVRCRECNKMFVVATQRSRVYCSKKCQSRWSMRELRKEKGETL